MIQLSPCRPCRALAAALLTVLATQSSREASAQSSRTPLTAQQLVERVTSGSWNVFTADVTVRRSMMRPDGTPALPPAVETYRWERVQTATGWRTSMTLLTQTRPVVATRSGPASLPDMPTVTRIEDDESGRAPRFFTRDGVEVLLPTSSRIAEFRRADAPGVDALTVEQALGAAAPGAMGSPATRPAGGREWIRALVMSAGSRAERVQAFSRQFGARAAVVRGLGQYVRDDADGRREVLVDERDGVPVEANVVEQGALVSHSTFDYERTLSGALIRRAVRLERALSAAGAARMVTEVRYDNIRVDQKGGR